MLYIAFVLYDESARYRVLKEFFVLMLHFALWIAFNLALSQLIQYVKIV